MTVLPFVVQFTSYNTGLVGSAEVVSTTVPLSELSTSIIPTTFTATETTLVTSTVTSRGSTSLVTSSSLIGVVYTSAAIVGAPQTIPESILSTYTTVTSIPASTVVVTVNGTPSSSVVAGYTSTVVGTNTIVNVITVFVPGQTKAAASQASVVSNVEPSAITYVTNINGVQATVTTQILAIVTGAAPNLQQAGALPTWVVHKGVICAAIGAGVFGVVMCVA
ncbi:hypothetical protein YB2330_001853 [Saitoella coloradoensis]